MGPQGFNLVRDRRTPLAGLITFVAEDFSKIPSALTGPEQGRNVRSQRANREHLQG